MEKSHSIGSIAHQVLTPLFKKHKHLQLMVDWPLIVGKEIASYAWPEKIVPHPYFGNILYIFSQKKIETWVASPFIMERVNQYMGYMAITRIYLSKRLCKGNQG